MGNFDSSGYSEVLTYPSGQIRSYRSSNPEEFFLNGVILVAAEDSTIEFFENGSVRSIVLADSTQLILNGTKVMLYGGEKIEFTEDGQIKL